MKDKKWEKHTFPGRSTVNLNNPFRSPFLHKILKTKEFKAYSEMDDLTLTIILLSAYIFMSDRFLSNSELAVLSNRIKTIYPSLDQKSIEKVIRRFAELFEPNPHLMGNYQYVESDYPMFGTRSGLYQLLKELKGWVARRTIKSSIAYLLFEIANADNRVTRAEKYYLVKICRHLGLLDMEISRMFAFFEGRVSEIKFHNKHSWNTTKAEKKAYNDQFKIRDSSSSKSKSNSNKQRSKPKYKPKSYAIDSAYLVLGITRNADVAAIKKAYRKLMMKYHSDKMIHASVFEKQTAKRMFISIQEAYERIKIARRIK